MAVHPYSLSVIRRGTELSSVPLSARPYFVVGRLPFPQSHIELAHPSVSRVHAVIQHRDDGRVFVFDCASSHGTFVNKRRVEAQTFVEVRVGDILRFGESERSYVLEGPDDLRAPEGELRRSSTQPTRSGARSADDSKHVQAKAAHDAADSEEEEAFASWGMTDDTPAADEEDGEQQSLQDAEPSSSLYRRALLHLTSSASLSSADWAALSAAQRALAQRVERKRQKAANLQAEVDTLEGKEMKQGGLNAGQQAQKERNERLIADIRTAIVDDLEQLKDAMLPTSGERAGKGAVRAGRHDDDGEDSDDDFFDRTRRPSAAARSASAPPVASSAEASASGPLAGLAAVSSLLTAVTVRAELHRCEELRDALRVVLRDLTVAGDADAGDDSLDAFMGAVDEQRRADRRDTIKEQLRALQSRYAKLESRLREIDAAERVQRFRERSGRTSSTDADAAEDARGGGDSRAEQAEPSEPPPPPSIASGVAASPGGGGVAEALARLRQPQPHGQSSASAQLPSTRPAAPIGPSLSSDSRPIVPTATAHSPAVASSPASGAATSSSVISDLARRLDLARASTVREHGGSGLGAVLKRRMERSLEADGDGKSADGGLLVRKKRAAERDRAEQEDSALADSADSTWKPPVGQSGDGHTERNARLGY